MNKLEWYKTEFQLSTTTIIISTDGITLITVLTEGGQALNPILLNFENILHELEVLDERIDNLECESIDKTDLTTIQLNSEEIEELNNSNVTDFFISRNLFPDEVFAELETQ